MRRMRCEASPSNPQKSKFIPSRVSITFLKRCSPGTFILKCGAQVW